MFLKSKENKRRVTIALAMLAKHCTREYVFLPYFIRLFWLLSAFYIVQRQSSVLPWEVRTMYKSRISLLYVSSSPSNCSDCRTIGKWGGEYTKWHSPDSKHAAGKRVSKHIAGRHLKEINFFLGWATSNSGHCMAGQSRSPPLDSNWERNIPCLHWHRGSYASPICWLYTPYHRVANRLTPYNIVG